MYTNPQHRVDPQAHQLRREAGAWLKELRERRGMSQRQLADKLGAEYYISQLETSRSRILQTDIQYYDPVTYGILFGKR